MLAATCSQLVMSGGFTISNKLPTELVRLPAGTDPKGILSVKNLDALYLYLKWTNFNESLVFDPRDAGIVLATGQSYTWDTLPNGKSLLALATSDGTRASVDMIALVHR